MLGLWVSGRAEELRGELSAARDELARERRKRETADRSLTRALDDAERQFRRAEEIEAKLDYAAADRVRLANELEEARDRIQRRDRELADFAGEFLALKLELLEALRSER